MEGRAFTVFTDHKPLTRALESKTDRSPRQTCHLSFIAEFTGDIQHVAGLSNVVADTLSRPPEHHVSAISNRRAVNYEAMSLAQRGLREELLDTSLYLEDVPWQGFQLLCDTSTGKLRPIVPRAFRRQIFSSVHDLSHPGPRPTQRMLSSRFVWPGLKKDVRDWCRACHSCQSAKIARHITTPVVKFEPASRRFGSCLLYTSDAADE